MILSVSSWQDESKASARLKNPEVLRVRRLEISPRRGMTVVECESQSKGRPQNARKNYRKYPLTFGTVKRINRTERFQGGLGYRKWLDVMRIVYLLRPLSSECNRVSFFSFHFFFFFTTLCGQKSADGDVRRVSFELARVNVCSARVIDFIALKFNAALLRAQF